MGSEHVIILGIIIAYLIFMVGIGVYSSKKAIKNSTDYLVAGRRLPWYLLIGTLAATEIGAGSTMGVCQKAYGEWGFGAVWYIWTMAISFLIVALVAPKLRRTEVSTVPEFFLQKYGKANHILTSIIMFLPLIGLTAVQMIATATIFHSLTGIDYLTSALISCGVIIIYTVLGGMWSVSITDFYQWLLIVIGMGLTLPFVLFKAGGWQEMMMHIPAEKLHLTSEIGTGTIISLIILYVSSMLVGQEVTQRLYSAKNEKNVFWGSLATSAFYVIFAVIPPLIGLSIFALENEGIISSSVINSLDNTKYILPVIALKTLPPVVVGLLFAGLISATMSSASSNLLGAASIFTNDIYIQYFKKDLSDDKKVFIIRILVAIVGVLSLLIAICNPKDIIAILMFSFALRSAGGFIPYVIGHYTTKITWRASLMSLIMGSISLIILELAAYKPFGIEPIVPALAISAVVTVVFSLNQNNT